MCLFESIVLAWIYGAEKFEKNIVEMLRSPILPYFRITWKYVTPLVTFGVLFTFMTQFEGIKYNNVYVYPFWGICFGWFLALSSMSCVPAYALYALFREKGNWKDRWIRLTTPKPTIHVEQVTKDVPDVVMSK